MRPVYETAKTKASERETLKRFLLDSPNRPVKLPMRYFLDWMILGRDGTLTAWVECKRRHNMRGKYPTFMMSMKKWQEGVELHRLGGKPFYIVVEWDDGIFYVRHDEVLSHVSYGIGGRTDRDDPEDIEPCVFIPISLFRPRVPLESVRAPASAANES